MSMTIGESETEYSFLSEDLHLRSMEHAAQLGNTMIDVGRNSLHYTKGRKAASRRMVAAVALQNEDENKLLGVGEQMLCWLLGLYQLKQPTHSNALS